MRRERVYKVKHVLCNYDEKQSRRTLDKYLLYKKCAFHKRIKYFFVGLNPSAGNDEFTDLTNLKIINFLFKETNKDELPIGSYYLSNLYACICSDSDDIDYRTYNSDLHIILSNFKGKVVVFYGASSIKNVSSELKKCFESLKSDDRLYMTANDNGEFRHPRCWDFSTIVKVTDISKICK